MKTFRCILNTTYQARCITVPKLCKSILYQLRFGHPVVDAVGLLPDQHNKYFLVFIQVFLSKYSDHKSKVHDIFKYKTNSSELLDHKNFFDYYKSLAKTVFSKFDCNNCLYINTLPKSSQDDSGKHSLELVV